MAQEAPAVGAGAPAAPAAAPVADTVEARFADWVSAYRAGAVARGLRTEWLDATLSGVTYSPRVVELDRAQPDDSGARATFSGYRAAQVNQARIDGARRRLATLAPTVGAIEGLYGVPGPVIAAIWGVETSVGANTGSFDMPRSLASLAFDGRRAALFTRELDAAVRMVGERGVPRDRLRGSWAGATGQPQFLPTSYLAHAVDGDGDGRADIWGSQADTLASIAKYLSAGGWQRGQWWGMAVGLPPTFDRMRVRSIFRPAKCVRPLERHSRWLTAREWQALGVVSLTGAWPPDATPMTLVEPDGVGGDAFLTTGSFRSLLEYNCSNFYALSVALIADGVRAADAPAAAASLP
jgi:lytic murein transglycosylase